MAFGDFGSNSPFNRMVVAQARGDGAYRVYTNGLTAPPSLDFPFGWRTLSEFSYGNGGWTRMALSGEPDRRQAQSFGFDKFFVAAARGDGTPRVYATNAGCVESGCNLWTEFGYTNGRWSGQAIDSWAGFDALGEGQAGDVRRDGFASLYVEASTVQGDQHLYELRWRKSSWTRSEVDSAGGALPVGSIAVGNARHDSINRIYLLTITQRQRVGPSQADIAEYTNVGGSLWEKAVIAQITSTSPYNFGWAFVGILPARQGQPALYLTGNDGSFHEVFFDGALWRHELVPGLLGPAAPSFGSCAGGEGRNDGVYRIYCIPYGASLLEELTRQGDTWLSTDQIAGVAEPNLNPLASVAIGPGRNDGRQRIYVEVAKFEFFLNQQVGKLVELTYKR